MFLENSREKIVSAYQNVRNRFPEIMKDIDAKIQASNEQRSLVLQYIYGHLRESDIAMYDFEIFDDFAGHSVMLWNEFQYVQMLPEEIFLEALVFPRIAEEELDVCRTDMYSAFLRYMSEENEFWKKSLEEAPEADTQDSETNAVEKLLSAMELWFCSEIDYKDCGTRIFSSKTVLHTGLGNLEELRVFVINACRSMGIPARNGKAVLAENGTRCEVCVEVYTGQSWKEFCWTSVDKEVLNGMKGEGSTEKGKIARLARANGKHWTKVRYWRNEGREMFFFGDLQTMNLRAKMLKVLTEKDQMDVKYEVLEEHFQESLSLSEQYPEEVFVSWVMNPRIADEVMQKWRKEIQGFLDSDKQKMLCENPEQIWDMVQELIQDISEGEDADTELSPAAVLKLRKGNLKSKKILFVAIARTLGIPARLNPDSGTMEYWDKGDFRALELWDIYDKKKNRTGRTMKRNDWCLKDDEYHLSVLGVVVRSDGKFLITKRVMTKHWAPGWWEVPGGAAMAGEASEEAVVREVFEETGLDVSRCEAVYRYTYHRENPGKGDNYFVDAYRFEMDFDEADIKIQQEETSGYMLAELSDIEALAREGIFLHYDSIRSVFEWKKTDR